ncbi:MAG: translation initiation factor IF-2 [Holosporales bacterium]|jgi:translation initiation factor IF-2|nr:translation initiation factor IF-2 [Holosporales bacterium]
MTIENNNTDKCNKTEGSTDDSSQQPPKRSTLSLKKVVVPRRVSLTSKTVEVEVKRKKSAGLRIDITAKREHFLEESEIAISHTDEQAYHHAGNLTDSEFQTRMKALQDAKKTEEIVVTHNEEDTTIDDILLEENYAETGTEIAETKKIEETISTITELPIPLKKRQISKKLEQEKYVPGREQVVFKANEYVKKQRPTEKLKKTETVVTATTSTVSYHKTDIESGYNISDAPRSLSKETLNERPRKTTGNIDLDEKKKTKSSLAKNISMGKRVSRIVIERALDGGDPDERTRFGKKKNNRQKSEYTEAARVVREVNIPDVIAVSELANRMAIRGADVVKYLMKIGTMATLNQVIDGDTAEVICTEFGHIPKRVSESDVETQIENIEDRPEDLEVRAPIVAIMGHVDHGKTTILDTLRKTNVAAKEAGGITQHVSAYQVESKSGNKITFIDTPGHAAFSRIRLRGAVITDIIVLVVAADDGVKEQTIEAISYAKSGNVPIIVAINKIDKPNTNVDKLKNELMAQDVVIEEFGGNVLSVQVSALKNMNLEGLIETILLQAEMMDLKANPNRKAIGTVLDSRVVKGVGLMAMSIIQHGTLRPGDIFVAGASYGKIRSLYNENNQRIEYAGPSTPVNIVGFNNNPEPGDIISVMDSEQKAREIAEYRARLLKEKATINSAQTMEQLMAGQAASKLELRILAKADVYGSLEALVASIGAIQHEEIELKVTEAGVGMINESDVDFAQHTDSLIIGFNVSVTSSAKNSAKTNNVPIYNSNIIYHVIEEIKRRMAEILPPIIEENYIGEAEVRKIFTISRFGTIAGCFVRDGIIKRTNSKIKIIRGKDCLFEGKIRSMKHEKDEIKESKQNHECGILVEGYDEFSEGDRIECYEIIERIRTIS